MAKQKGFIKIRGSIGGLTFYENNGKDLIKTSGGVSKERIMSDPAYKRTRENMQEFGGSAKVGKALRKGLATVISTMSDRIITARLTGNMKRINAQGLGLRGQRAFDIPAQKDELIGFELNKIITLDAIYFAPGSISFNANRDQVTWDIPDFNTDNFIHPPEGASHFKLVLAIVALSNYTFDATARVYEPVNPVENGLNDVQFSVHIPLGGLVGSNTSLVADLGLGSALPATLGVIVCTGIVFYQQINGLFYELSGNNAMHIKEIG